MCVCALAGHLRARAGNQRGKRRADLIRQAASHRSIFAHDRGHLGLDVAIEQPVGHLTKVDPEIADFRAVGGRQLRADPEDIDLLRQQRLRADAADRIVKGWQPEYLPELL